MLKFLNNDGQILLNNNDPIIVILYSPHCPACKVLINKLITTDLKNLDVGFLDVEQDVLAQKIVDKVPMVIGYKNSLPFKKINISDIYDDITILYEFWNEMIKKDEQKLIYEEPKIQQISILQPDYKVLKTK